MDETARRALGHLIRTELCPELDHIDHRLRDLQRQVDALGARTGGPVRPDARDREIRRLHEAGLSARLIAIAVDVDRATVSAQTCGLPPPARVIGRDGRSTRPRRKAVPQTNGRPPSRRPRAVG